MHILRSLFTASLLSASAFGQNGFIPPPPVVDPGTTPAPVVTPEAAPAAASNGFALPNTLSPEEKAQGWRLFFDGSRLIGMKGVQKSDPMAAGWKVEAGELKLPKAIKDTGEVTGGDLMTSDLYYDFDFRFEWKTTASAESGVRYMLAEQIGKSPEGLEYQIIDDVHNSKGLKGGPVMRSSALEGIIAPGANASLRTADPLERRGDPWNEGRIVVQGAHIEHWLNGEKVLEFDLGPTLRNSAAANGLRFSPTWGQKRTTKIALLDQGTEVAYRNLKIKVLSPTAALTARPVVPGTRPGAPPAAPVVPVNPYLLPKRNLPPK